MMEYMKKGLTDIEKSLAEKRHTLAHLLAAAVLEHYPKAKPTIGPAVDTGFYYDFEFPKGATPGEQDLKKIEDTMREILPYWNQFTREVVTPIKALKVFKDNEYKTELIKEIRKEKKDITFYTSGPNKTQAQNPNTQKTSFTDLCRGGHVKDPSKDIAYNSFKLDRISGAYWRGSEENTMLTRIYGVAFDTKEDLDTYITQREEALKRDHRKIAREQNLIVFSDLVGSGMPLYTPKGNVIRNEIIKYSRELNIKLGFGEVHTPNINKGELFKISGHYDQYKEDMLSVRSQYVSDEMFLKPMNCPQHTQIYASQPRSYRDLPVRYADFANLYRDERPGELSGLTRLRAFAQDDGHIFCREDQIELEVSSVLSAIQEALKTYNIDYWMRLSLSDPKNKEKYLGDPKTWKIAERLMRELLISKKIDFKESIGEAAFYGPKIDIMAVDAIGRNWQISTVQLDFVQPSRFKLEYADADGTKSTPVMIHRALIGSPDRFLGILIEHYAGAFPLWLAPVQVSVLPVSDKHTEYAHQLVTQLTESGIRAELQDQESLGKRIRECKVNKVPYFLVVGDTEVADGTATLESRDMGKVGALTIGEISARLSEEIRIRKA